MFPVLFIVFVNITSLTTALWLFFVLFAISGLPNITSQIGTAGAVQRLCPPEILGRFQGISSATQAVGAIGGSVLVGALLDPLGAKPLLNAQAVLYVLCGLLAFALLVRADRDEPVAQTLP